MAIFVFNKGNNEAVNFVSKSLRNEGISRFGWSYYDSANLKDLEQQSWESMNEKEIETWNKSKFLLGIKQGDWVLHINVPYWGAFRRPKLIVGTFLKKRIMKLVISGIALK